MKIIYPQKTQIDINKEIDKYQKALKKSKEVPLWWNIISFIWFIFNTLIIFFFLKQIAFVLKNIKNFHFEFIGITLDSISISLLTISLMLAIILISKKAELLIKGLLFPETKMTGNYFDAKHKLLNILKEYENAENLKNDILDKSTVSFQVLNEKNNITGTKENKLYIQTVNDGLKKSFSFNDGTYKIKEDKENIVDLSVADKLVDKIIEGTEITNI